MPRHPDKIFSEINRPSEFIKYARNYMQEKYPHIHFFPFDLTARSLDYAEQLADLPGFTAGPKIIDQFPDSVEYEMFGRRTQEQDMRTADNHLLEYARKTFKAEANNLEVGYFPRHEGPFEYDFSHLQDVPKGEAEVFRVSNIVFN